MSMAELRRVYWDANVWLGLINGEPNKIRAVDYIYNAARTGTHEIWTSTLAFVEVFRIAGEEKLSKPYSDGNLDKIEEMFEQDFIKLVPVDVEVAKLARRLRREHSGLSKGPDAIHLASAIRWSVETLHTFDKADLLHLDNKLKMKSGLLLRIVKPEEPSAGPLFETPP